MKWQAKDNPTVAELAWAAGALDGEGCIGVYQMPSGKSRYLQLTVMVENTDPRMPLKFQEIFGGTVRLCKRQYSEKDRPATVWQIAGKKVGPMLQSMLP